MAKQTQFPPGTGRTWGWESIVQNEPNFPAGPGGTGPQRRGSNVRNEPNFSTGQSTGPLRQTNPICPAPTGMGAGWRGGDRCRRGGQSRQTNPISPRAAGRASAVWERSCGQWRLPRGSAKQSQFPDGQQRPRAGGAGWTNEANLPTQRERGAGRGVTGGAVARGHLRQTNPICPTSAPRGDGGTHRAKRSQFPGVEPKRWMWNPPPGVDHTQRFRRDE